MTRSKKGFKFRPFVERLENRLQPGSIIAGRGYGWSILADGLLNLDQGRRDSQTLISYGFSEGDRPTLRRISVGVSGDHHDNAAVFVMPGQNETSSLLSRGHGDSLAINLTNDDLGTLSPAGPRDRVVFVHMQNSLSQPPTVKLESSGIGEAPTGVTTSAQPVMDTVAGAGISQSPRAVSLTPSNTRAATPGHQLVQATVVLDAPQPVREPADSIAPLVRTVPNVRVATTHRGTGGIHPFVSQPVWASYLGGSGDDRLLGVALNPDHSATQPVVVTGFTQNTNDPTEFDAVIARFSTDGTTATMSTIGYGPGTRTEGHAVDVDSAGNIYLIGQTGQTADARTTTDLIARVDTTGNVTWTISLTPANSTGVGNGIKLDAAGTNLFLTGAVDGNLWVAKLTDLASAQPSIVYNSVFPVSAGSRVGNAIGSDSAGDADLAFTLSSGTDNRPGWAQVTPDGSSIQADTFDSFGPKAGMFGITVDASDNFYVTGAIGQGASPFTVLVVAKFDINLTPLYRVGWSLTDSNGVRNADWIGRDIKIDSSGDAYMATVVDSGGGANMTVFAVGPAGTITLERQGDAFGADDDQNRGLALDTTDNVLYLVGFTNSPDFNFTSGSFQSTYGGDPYDGVVIQDQLS